MDMQNMPTLPVKYLKPIIMNLPPTTGTAENISTNFSASQFQTTTTTSTTNYQVPATDFTTTTDVSASYTQSQSTFGAASSTSQAGVKVLSRGSGITANEQNNIISVAMNVIQNHLEPISNNTARGVKKQLKGDWLVIVYEQGKPIDFNMTCVQGNDYLYFTIDNTAFQVCRLK